ncbi:MAG: zinc-binding alcohol dehydrogenase [Opitutales bacterium]|nr:zinc-binding alcohol dehydrogenase [Opitutales bacterium]
MKTPCLLFTGPGRVLPASTEIPAPRADEILVRTAYTCISPSTELRCLSGEQTGAPAFPFIPGYNLAGIVEEAGDVSGWEVGDRVFATGTRAAAHARCWGGHCGFALVRGSDAVAVPAGLSLRAASSTKLAAIAYHGLLQADVRPHERVAVVGLGPIGRFSAELFRAAGARVVVSDLSERRRASAARSGLTTIDPGKDLVQAFAEVCPEGVDIIVDATGAGAALAQTMRLGRMPPWDQEIHPPTRFILQGSYAKPPPFPYDTAFDRELILRVPRDCKRSDMRAVLDLMARGQLDPETFIEAVDTPAEAPAVYERLRNEPEALLTASIRWADLT